MAVASSSVRMSSSQQLASARRVVSAAPSWAAPAKSSPPWTHGACAAPMATELGASHPWRLCVESGSLAGGGRYRVASARIRRFHGRDARLHFTRFACAPGCVPGGCACVSWGERRQELPVSQPSGPVRPPLSAFRVAMFIRDGGADGDHGLVLRCEDPVHPETYVLSPSRSDRDAILRDVRFLAEHAEFDVTRGEESFTFRTPLKPALDQSVLRARGTGPTPYQTRDRSSREAAVVFNSADLSAARSLKILSHRDKDGRAIGMRVTGLRPGGWAEEFGFQVGDIIETESATQLKDPTALRSAVRSGWRPTHVTVRRVIWGETHRLSVDGT